jgi:hypothetical protein
VLGVFWHNYRPSILQPEKSRYRSLAIFLRWFAQLSFVKDRLTVSSWRSPLGWRQTIVKHDAFPQTAIHAAGAPDVSWIVSCPWA